MQEEIEQERDNGYVPLKKYKVFVTKRADVDGTAIVVSNPTAKAGGLP